MKKFLKIIGLGFLCGLRHPFTERFTERQKDMDTMEALVDDLGTSLGQGLFHAVYGPVCVIVIFSAIGAISKHLEDTPIKVKAVVEK